MNERIKIMNTERLERLKETKRKIESYSFSETNFKDLERLILNEIHQENHDLKSRYVSNLKGIVSYEIFKYKSSISKRPTRDNTKEYNEIINRFELFVNSELRYLSP